ncbi:hypothetical protein UAW_02945 [Enterococcus haemoperoxidus ATCC BAA-382]|uniref:Uncharacterized protein n=1 Tax=Enterococcus haemoperoxidus ATCC BAA-382 TaxID=1158608 RepID=R2SY44_9ENTE|nr:DUF916 and DUF3324 domain-containing protein [Enterococcus haemoperoxidus]EOH92904.1 hypothetical protein UAW_02945 [Enterococcus haemoperoxidus ATCC BAA-382]EOT61647.1 hypothetical protein I583_00629 [Enterococcus haemoperoxidus ATCC BAA-382]
MKKRIYHALILVSCAFMSLVSTREVFAEDENNLGYVVTPLQPTTQIDVGKSYFYIKTAPGETQTLQMRIASTKKEEVHLKIYGVNAMTSNSGTIEYTEDLANKDESLKEPLSSLIKVETPEITVGNFEEKTVKVQVAAPKEHYEGVKMGALVVELVPDKKKQKGISTKYNYKIGLMTAENGDEFTNGKTLKLNGAKASILHGKKMVLASLQNPEPKVIDNLNIVATMIEKESGKVIKEKTVQNYKLAPNSHFDFELDWGITDLPSGTYTLKMDAKNYDEEWHLSNDFKITNEEAQEINASSVFKIKTPTWLKVVSIVMAMLSVVLMGTLFYRRKKWEKAWKRLRIAKKKKKKGKNKK